MGGDWLSGLETLFVSQAVCIRYFSLASFALIYQRERCTTRHTAFFSCTVRFWFLYLARSRQLCSAQSSACITGIGGPSYDAWRRHMTAVSYDGPEASYDGGVI